MHNQDTIINCTASGHGALLFGDNDGTVYMVTRSFEVASFQAYEEYIQHMYQLKTQGILVTVGVSSQSQAGAKLISLLLWWADCSRGGLLAAVELMIVCG